MALAELRQWLGRRRGTGRQTPPPGRPIGPATVAEPPQPAMSASHPDSAWTPERVALEEELWGPGYLSPGGPAELLRFAVPLGLSAASSLLLLGVGAGGPAQTLAAELGVWTAAFEADPVLAQQAAHRIQRAGAALAKRAAIAPWAPEDPAFRPNFHHHGLLLDAIRHGVPEQVLAAVTAALKPHGHIVVVETVAERPLDRADPGVAAWLRLEARQPELPSQDAINRALGRLGYDIRVVEDASARHMRLAVLGWKAFLRGVAAQRPDRTRAATIVTEAELWTRRIRLMHEGRIRQLRWHAIHRAGAH